MKVTLITTSGQTTEHDVESKNYRLWIELSIGAACLDSVNLRDGRFMLVDDTGAITGKPVNYEATRLYHGVCIPGTTHEICGDVAIVYGDRA